MCRSRNLFSVATAVQWSHQPDFIEFDYEHEGRKPCRLVVQLSTRRVMYWTAGGNCTAWHGQIFERGNWQDDFLSANHVVYLKYFKSPWGGYLHCLRLRQEGPYCWAGPHDGRPHERVRLTLVQRPGIGAREPRLCSNLKTAIPATYISPESRHPDDLSDEWTFLPDMPVL